MTGHGSFYLQRIHLGDDAFDCQRVQLAGFLLVLAREGSIILNGDDCSLLLQEGDAALIPPSRFRITEIPRLGFTQGETLYWFFNQRTLADLIAGKDGVHEMAARVSLPELPFYPVPRLGGALSAAAAFGSLRSLTDLRTVFIAMFNTGAALAYNFVKHAVFVPRIKLCLYLETQCLGVTDLAAIAKRYPEGPHAFRRDSAFYLGMPVTRWLFRRKVELAQTWLRYSDRSEQEVAHLLGYDDLRVFRGHLKRYGRFSPLELEALRRFGSKVVYGQDCCPPFWLPDRELHAAAERRRTSDFLWLAMTARGKRELLVLLKKYPDEQPSLPAISSPVVDASAPSETPLEPDAEQPVLLLGKLIELEAVEAWRIGKSSLRFNPVLTELAA